MRGFEIRPFLSFSVQGSFSVLYFRNSFSFPLFFFIFTVKLIYILSDKGIFVVSERLPSLLKFFGRLPADTVVNLRTVDGHTYDVTILLVKNVLIGQMNTSFFVLFLLNKLKKSI